MVKTVLSFLCFGLFVLVVVLKTKNKIEKKKIYQTEPILFSLFCESQFLIENLILLSASDSLVCKFWRTSALVIF